MKDLGLSKNLISAVSSIVATSNKQQQEQSQQKAPAYNQHYGKLGAARPLSMEDAKAATQEAHAPARRVAATIRGMYVTEEKKTTDAFEKETLKKRKERGQGEAVDEGKEHTVPKTAKEKSLAALATPKDKITHKDVMVGRGVVAKEEVEQVAELNRNTIKSYLAKKMDKIYSASAPGKAKAKKDMDSLQRAHERVVGNKPTSEEVEQLREFGDLPKIGMTGNHPGPFGVYHRHGKGEDDLKIVSKHKTLDSALKHVHKLEKKTGKEHVYGNLLAHKPEHGEIPKKFNEEVEQVEEGSAERRASWDAMLKDVKDRAKPQPAGGAGVKKGTRYGGANQKDEKPMKEEVVTEEVVQENQDTPGNSYAHQCAIHVKHAKLGEGRTLFSQHADPAEDGTIEWYDVMFEHGIEKKVPTADLEILVTESHMNHKKKKM